MSGRVEAVSYERTIRPGRAWYRVDWARLYHYRDLLWILVRRDFVSRYQQTILGPAWFVVQPLLATTVFTVVFARGLGTKTDEVPPFLFYLCGMLVWNYFATVLASTGSTFAANAAMFGKIYFPRVIVPLAATISGLIAFGVQLGLFLVVYAAYALWGGGAGGVGPEWAVLAALPLALGLAALLALGCGLLLSAASAKYRDLQHVVPLLVQLWMFLTPIVYPLSQLSPRVQWVAALNPLTSVVELFRRGFFGAGGVTPGQLACAVAGAVAALALGFAWFQRVERTVVDTA